MRRAMLAIAACFAEKGWVNGSRALPLAGWIRPRAFLVRAVAAAGAVTVRKAMRCSQLLPVFTNLFCLSAVRNQVRPIDS